MYLCPGEPPGGFVLVWAVTTGPESIGGIGVVVPSSVHYYLFKLILLNQLHIGICQKDVLMYLCPGEPPGGFCACIGSCCWAESIGGISVVVLSSVHYYLFKLILLNQLHIGICQKDVLMYLCPGEPPGGFCACIGSCCWAGVHRRNQCRGPFFRPLLFI
jgi:hypothetical protein